MGNKPRKHHYLPKFWIRGFARSNAKRKYENWPLHTLHNGKVRKTTVREVGHRRDYYRLERTDMDPFEVEERLIEADLGSFVNRLHEITPAENRGEIRKLLDDLGLGPIPERGPGNPEILKSVLNALNNRRVISTETEEFSNLLWFVALMAARVPAGRSTIDRINELSVRAREVAKYECKYIRRVPLERIDWSNFPGPMTHDERIFEIFHFAIEIYRCLLHREWLILIADERLPDFICSDCPVSCVFTVDTGSDFMSPAPGTPNTRISFPLSSRAAILSAPNPTSDLSYGVVSLDRRNPISRALIATVNMQTLVYANQLFWAADDFVYMMKDGHLGGVQKYIQLLRTLSPIPNAS